MTFGEYIRALSARARAEGILLRYLSVPLSRAAPDGSRSGIGPTNSTTLVR